MHWLKIPLLLVGAMLFYACGGKDKSKVKDKRRSSIGATVKDQSEVDKLVEEAGKDKLVTSSVSLGGAEIVAGKDSPFTVEEVSLEELIPYASSGQRLMGAAFRLASQAENPEVAISYDLSLLDAGLNTNDVGCLVVANQGEEGERVYVVRPEELNLNLVGGFIKCMVREKSALVGLFQYQRRTLGSDTLVVDRLYLQTQDSFTVSVKEEAFYENSDTSVLLNGQGFVKFSIENYQPLSTTVAAQIASLTYGENYFSLVSDEDYVLADAAKITVVLQDFPHLFTEAMSIPQAVAGQAQLTSWTSFQTQPILQTPDGSKLITGDRNFFYSH